ncbi:MAG: caspase family protein [Hyphomicrobium sp.]
MWGRRIAVAASGLGVGLMLFSGAVSAESPRRIALVIGIADYQHVPVLPNPVNDARAMAALLREHGIEATVVESPDHATLLVALSKFRRAAEGAELALVYYAGHGIHYSGSDVLLPRDVPARCDPKTREEALAGTVGLDEVMATVAAAKNRVVILDACRTRSFPSCPKRGDDAGGFRDLGRVANSRGTLVATSTAEGGVASDGPRNGNSPYNTLLRQALQARPQSYVHDVLIGVNGELGDRPAGQTPELYFKGVPPKVCLMVQGCGRNTAEEELAEERKARRNAEAELEAARKAARAADIVKKSPILKGLIEGATPAQRRAEEQAAAQRRADKRAAMRRVGKSTAGREQPPRPAGKTQLGDAYQNPTIGGDKLRRVKPAD